MIAVAASVGSILAGCAVAAHFLATALRHPTGGSTGPKDVLHELENLLWLK